MDTVYDELSSALKAKFKPGSDVQDYLKKVIDKADKLDDKAWEKLSEDTQEWINSAVEAHESGSEIPVPEGLELDDDDEDEDDLPDLDDDDDEDEEEELPRRAKNGRSGKHATKAAAPAKKRGRPAKAKAEDDEDEDEDETPKKKRGRPAKAAKEKPAKAAKGKAEKKKPAKAAKPEKKAKKGGTGGGRRERSFKDDQVITVLVDENPKRPHTASYERFELYKRGKKGMTVKEALKAGVTSGDLKWDSERNFIKIS